MRSQMLSAARSARFLSCFIALLLPAAVGWSAEIVEIEEYWSLQVQGPDINRSGPQVTVVMSPTDNLAGDYFVVTLNHWNIPDFVPGGIQTQHWSDEDCLHTAEVRSQYVLENDGEVITWVQHMSVSEGMLKFSVHNGTSQTWSAFGVDGRLALNIPTQLTNLDGYKPAVSISESGIGYAGNRVSSLVLQKIRWVTADGEEHEVVAPIDIATVLSP